MTLPADILAAQGIAPGLGSRSLRRATPAAPPSPQARTSTSASGSRRPRPRAAGSAPSRVRTARTARRRRSIGWRAPRGGASRRRLPPASTAPAPWPPAAAGLSHPGPWRGGWVMATVAELKAGGGGRGVSAGAGSSGERWRRRRHFGPPRGRAAGLSSDPRRPVDSRSTRGR